ncbi:hypothetical protein [Chakrabartyella piscis]|uniref:hypothetical protein n=1 Tax=Chakrabartyella piscis TaxID=2918914 RepID=UPI002958B85C|nr:hypothetical protein [Chakrabartyella piscis]
MSKKSTKLTFSVTEEMQELLGNCKKEFFDDQNTSEMIRELLLAGFRSLDEQEQAKTDSEESA